MHESKTLNERSLLRAIFDALPSLVFLVDQDVQIIDCNAAAAELIMAADQDIILRRAGEILHCIHSTESPEGCGRSPSCKKCIIRNSVVKAFLGNRIVRKRTRIEYIRDGKKTEVFALVTASPFFFTENPYVLLLIEDINEIASMCRMVFLCPVCGKMQNGQKTWMRIESYFKRSWDVDCSHNYCPDCFQIEMEKIKKDDDQQN